MTRKKSDDGVLLPLASDRGSTRLDRDVAEQLADRALHRYGRGYARLGTAVLLHHFVIGKPPRGMVTDHINGNRLDNRRCNLRHVSYARNRQNTRSCRGKFRYRGVSSNKGRPALWWRKRCLGRFRDPLVAALWRDEVVWRDTRYRDGLNFPYFVRRRDVPGLLRSAGRRLFSVTFVKRTDEALRTLVGRFGVNAGVKGKGLAFDPARRDLLAVFDMHQRNYRFIPLEGLVCLSCNGKKFRVVP